MITKEFKYSDDAHYPHSSIFKTKQINIINQNIVITSDNKNFKTSYPNLRFPSKTGLNHRFMKGFEL